LAPNAPERPWTAVAGGFILMVRLTPRGGRDAVDGVEQLSNGQYVLKARVRVAASEGEANAALLRLLSRELGIAPRDITLVAGASARIKRLKISVAPAALAAALERFAAIS
jgi:uncharacterized protein